MIVLFTSNSRGGILQFSILLKRVINEIGYEAVLFCPSDSLIDDNEENIVFYNRPRTLYYKNASINKIKKNIEQYKPKIVLFMDDVISSAQVSLNIGLDYNKAMIIHDVTPHITYNLKKRIKRAFILPIIEKSYKDQKMIICLSENSKNQIGKLYPALLNKTYRFTLGAHLTTEELEKPKEIRDEEQYILFFGRIDKYKGLEILVNQYAKMQKKSKNVKLVIAGNGIVDDFLYNEIERLNIIFINRYIKDEEMNWLFYHSRVVVLPYIEASQSGIIPIAYHFGKPVLVSNLPGLTENVIIHETGEVFYEQNEMAYKLLKLYNHSENMKQNIFNYEKCNLSWEENVRKLIENLE